MSHRHLLSPKLFYFCLLYSHPWLFQTSHNGPLISLWVPSSVSTLSPARIYNDLVTVLTKWFSIMAQGSLQIYLLQNSFLFGRQYLLSRVSSWSSIVNVTLPRGLQNHKMGWSNSNFILIIFKPFQLPFYYCSTFLPSGSLGVTSFFIVNFTNRTTY